MSIYSDHVLGPDIHANRPVATAVPKGAVYSCTTHNLIYRSDGAAWQTWATLGGTFTDPTTTKGDLLARSASAASRLAVGADGTSLVADAAQALGVKYENRVKSVVAGTGVTVDNTDPLNPIVAASGGGGGAAWTSAINDPLSTTTNLLTALSGTWAINAGVLRQSNASGTAQRAHATAVTPTAVRAVECEMAYISGSGTRRLGLQVSWKNVSGGDLFVYLESTNGTTWTLKAENEGVVLIFTSAAAISYAGSGYVRLGVIQSGTLLDFYINGVWVDSLNAISSNQWQSGKYVGLNSQNAVVDFRNLKAWTFLPSPF